jgi:hypothetical protein
LFWSRTFDGMIRQFQQVAAIPRELSVTAPLIEATLVPWP